MKTIRRNAHRKIAALALTIVKVEMYDQNTGNMVDSTVNAALANLGEYDFAKLYDHENGKYTVHVHSNRFYYLYTQARLDRDAADRAALDAKYASERAALTSDETVAVAKALTSARHHGASAGAYEQAAVTVVRTRMAISDQIRQACDALGITVGNGWAKGAPTYVVNGRDYTAGELADLVLEGGFAANYNGNEVRVNWDSPLIAPIEEADAAAELFKLADELDNSESRSLGESAALIRLHLRKLRGIAQRLTVVATPEQGAKIDFPPGAAEPGKDVTAVQCVRTGRVWAHDYTAWTCSAIGWTTGWYHLNIIDPVSEGFRIYHKEGMGE